MPTILYGAGQSRAIRTLWMLEELGVEFEHKPISFQADTKTDEFLAVNPNGRVPTLVTEDGEVYWESMSINLYLAKQDGGPLAPANLQEDALATQWSFWMMTEMEKTLLEVLFYTLGAMGYPKDADKAKEYEALLARPFKVLEAHLSSREWLVAERFTVADLNVASLFPWAKMAGIDLGGYPSTAKWVDACLSRPAFARASARP
ncbi:MAG: glutathione S-transferase family protein [Gammaproteobacteria bacterium]|nr:glutathione S-transferase family protein [Gammaproteobacteria bacterium]MCY4198842.1 glutathione S-transferase family protein [Gammaproteobacteria bacterium]MCY4323822.1 glutathione S-transferase family protein [Gammaproteobacteria bacterium]